MSLDTVTGDLRHAGVRYSLLHHHPTRDALAEAWILELDPSEVAKTVVFATRKGHVRAVVAADARVWRTKLQEVLDEDVWPCSQDELRRSYPEFEPGAVPPFGGPADAVIVDTAVAGRASVVFEAARNDVSLRMPGSALVELAGAWVSDIREPDSVSST